MKYPSRAREVDIEQCIRGIPSGNKFDLIVAAAQRAREIRTSSRNSNGKQVVSDNHPVITALLEFQSGKYLGK